MSRKDNWMPKAGEKFYAAMWVDEYGPCFVTDGGGNYRVYKTFNEAAKEAQRYLNKGGRNPAYIIENTAMVDMPQIPVEVTVVKP